MAVHNPVSDFIHFQRRRDGYSQLEKDDYNYNEGLRQRKRKVARIKPTTPLTTEETSFITDQDLHDAELGRVQTSNYRTFNIDGRNVDVPLGKFTLGDKLVLTFGLFSVFVGAGGALYYCLTSDSNNNQPITEEEYKPGLNLPGHKFIGPLNTIGKAVPVDKDDEIARIHDIRYKGATARPDIVAADNDAIHQFGDDFEKTGNIHSKVGEIGLRIKQGVEHFTGPLYPKIKGIFYFL